MGTFGKVVALSGGALCGMGVGFYMKEHYYLKQNKKKRDELMDELERLTILRKRKAEKLQTLTHTSKTI